MKFSRSILSLSLAFTLVFATSIFAQDDEEFAPRGGTGTITIITDPPNSDVYLDGDALGKSPITKKQFRSGPLKLIIMDQNKELINTRFNVWPNKENVYKGQTTMPSGTILVNTTPNKCRVLLDGEIADQTDGGPLTINSVDAGDHTVGAQCPGLRLFEELINVKGEQTTEIHLNAKSRKATVKLHERKIKTEEEE